jgi:hypothetical protein
MNKAIHEKTKVKGIVYRRAFNTPYLKHLLELHTGVNFDDAYKITANNKKTIDFNALTLMALDVIKSQELDKYLDMAAKPQFADNFVWKLIYKLTKKDIILPGITGHWTTRPVKSNLVTNVGHAGYAGQVGGVTSTAFTAIAYGTGATAAAVTDTALQTEVSRGAATVSRVTTSVTNDTSQWVKTFTAGGTQAITEEGILDNNSTGGNLLAHNVFSAVNMVNGDTLQFTHQIQS